MKQEGRWELDLEACAWHKRLDRSWHLEASHSSPEVMKSNHRTSSLVCNHNLGTVVKPTTTSTASC